MGNGGISIGSGVTTEINEPAWARLFKIFNTERFEVKNSKLIMYRNNEQGSIVKERY